MDKENLYYVVLKGTNWIETIAGREFIGGKTEATERAERLSLVFKEDLIVMSVREYEEKFTDKEPEVKKEPASYNLYSTGKHLLGMYNNKVIVLNLDGDIVERILFDPEVVRKICRYIDIPNLFQNHAEQLIEELIESATLT